MDSTEHLLRPILLLWKNKKLIILSTLGFSILAAVIVLIKPNYYQSSSLFYPASTDLAKPMPIGNQDQKMLYYGESGDLDRLFSIAKSRELKRQLIDIFDLYTHYDIDTTSLKAAYAMDLKLNKLYQVEKTKYDALKLSIEDKDPAFAQQMAKTATDILNSIAQQVVKQSQATLINSYKHTINEKNAAMKILSDSITLLRSTYNVYNLENQSMAYAELIPETSAKLANLKSRYSSLKSNGAPKDTLTKVKSLLNGYQAQSDALKQEMNLFNNGYLTILSAENEQESFNKQLSLDKQRLSQLEAAYNSPFSAIHLVQSAEYPIIKSRPKRTLILLGVALATLLFTSLIILIKDLFSRLT